MPVEKKDDNVQKAEEEEDEEECTAAFKPVVTLPIVEIKTCEEEEEVLLKLRAKLYRYSFDSQEPEWKERGTGELKILKNPKNKTIRIVMRRDKTLKVCANHFIKYNYELKPVKGSAKAFIYNSHADYSDETPKSECFAIKFGNVDYANQFKEVFNESKMYVKEFCNNEEEACGDKNLSCKMDELNISNDEVIATETTKNVVE